MNQDKKRVPMGAFAGLCSYLLVGLFAVLALFCVIVGAEVYRGTVENSRENAALRNAMSYVTGKVRTADAENAIRIAEGPEGNMLELSETIDGEDYITYIYGYRGEIRELFTAASYGFDPEAGEIVASAQRFSPSMEAPGLICLNVTLNNEDYASHIALGSEQED